MPNTESGIYALSAYVNSHVAAGAEVLFRAGDMGSYVTLLQKQLIRIKEEISYAGQEMEKNIDSAISFVKNYELLTSIKGIGRINAIVLLGVTDNFPRFSDPRKFACYCGVASLGHTSGTFIRGKTRTSQLANREVKVHLARAAITAMV